MIALLVLSNHRDDWNLLNWSHFSSLYAGMVLLWFFKLILILFYTAVVSHLSFVPILKVKSNPFFLEFLRDQICNIFNGLWIHSKRRSGITAPKSHAKGITLVWFNTIVMANEKRGIKWGHLSTPYAFTQCALAYTGTLYQVKFSLHTILYI